METITALKLKNGSYAFARGELTDAVRQGYLDKGYVLTEEVGMTMPEVHAKYLNLSFDKNGNHV